ncbi:MULTISPECIES: AI-2E family transporter [unclassified Mesorhizobium]|uniref:AI-2E family transporter n=1 Tax=unclassified Mesorhizobium TaxID=325217 RepID=UPI00112E1CD2|nr:AI-2E family transporter [Mesorhizobium sp. B2-8-1]TPJ42856.1 AI-2E family transporter [Mesorhizobium sp. B2-6-6]TPJ50621.1 AI-2E family transporter [Mesorhizobium sp. B2-6-4]TPJ91372.1 AI-2E family transporter [Mesorhizobium sp. B2-5-12]TPK21019.1 AI-2E family transporter [Mesorhizobium sp. B2-5-6]TPK45056.1 AI-2E family transporter [Mesorhizobium sp. B2-5-2]TPK58710.1 AI-2E family transporter [Mesorhizobium sp. B2-5-1]TPL14195.1 AI-2E family transporter [Mesorhizobium sp. B2-4-10]TPL15
MPPAFMTSKLATVVAMIATVAILYVAKEVLLPLAIAVLLTFALAPIVSLLRKLKLPRMIAVLGAVASAFVLVSLFSLIVATQVSQVAQDIPTYQSNILEKIRTLKETGSEDGLISRLGKVFERVNTEINKSQSSGQADVEQTTKQQDPLLVQIFSPQRPIETLRNIIEPLIGPLATTGLVIIVVIFMLLEREELRDRFIRLVGYSDLHRTTQALQDAGSRVGQYLLMQLVVNIVYGVPLAIGLWFLGIPNALLWGMLAVVLRFVPFIGPVIAAVIPLFLAFAVAPGWSLLVWTGALFILAELVISNIVEPWLYGSHTGLSPLAIIVAAVFWAWLWGPVGLVLSTPLTVCLVVLGRHVPQFEFLQILFGDEPVLDPKERLYQRLLADDIDEATDNAEEMLEEKYLIEFHSTVAIPALLLGEQDRARGALTASQLANLAENARTLVANLNEIAAEEEEEEEDEHAEKEGASADPGEEDEDQAEFAPDLPDGAGKSVLCIGGRGDLDDVAAAMLAQVISIEGADCVAASHRDLLPARIRKLPLEARDAVVVGFLNRDSFKHAVFVVRRLRRLAPRARIGIALWHDTHDKPREDAAGLAEQLEADFVAFNVVDCVTGALSNEEPRQVKKRKQRNLRRPRARQGVAATVQLDDSLAQPVR